MGRPGRADGRGDGGGRIRFEGRQGDGDGSGGFLPGVDLTARMLLVIIGGALLLLLSLVFIFTQTGDDTNDGGTVTPTATVESVLNPIDGIDRTDADAPSTPASGDATQPADDATDPAADETSEAAEEEEEPRRGGDNQLNPSDDATETPES